MSGTKEPAACNRPLRILTVADVPPDPNAGAAGTVYHTNVALRELGHRVDEIWADELGPRRIRHGNLHSLLEQPRAYRRAVLERVSRREYDVVQMSQPQAYLAARALKQRGFRGVVINRSHGLELRVNAVLPAWHRKLGVPESRFPRSLLTPLLRRWLERQWTAVARHSDGVILPCHDDREFLLRRLDVAPERVQVIHHGVPDEYLRTSPLPLTPARSRRLLYVGQAAFFKAPRLLATIANEILGDLPDATMTWVTSASAHAQIQAMLSPVSRPRVLLRDWVGQHELMSIYDEHGIFIFPSLIEGAGKAALEAMSRGLCVVTSDTSGMKDYIRSGWNGCLCAVGQSDCFSAAIRLAYANTERLEELGSHARRSAQAYTWTGCAAKACRFYEALRVGRAPGDFTPCITESINGPCGTATGG